MYKVSRIDHDRPIYFYTIVTQDTRHGGYSKLCIYLTYAKSTQE